MSTRSMARQGFTLVELLITLIIAAIVGAALLRMVVAQGRFMDQQEASRSARSVSRSGINRLVSDLRAVEAFNGLQAAVAGGQDFTVRVPYAFGVVCAHAGAITTISLLPVDSAMFNAPGYSGFAWRNAAGTYSYFTGGAVVAPGTAILCQNVGPDSIHTLAAAGGAPAGQIVNITGLGLGIVPPRGSLVFLYRRVRYEFKASVAVPGQTGLWRTTLNGGGPAEELAAPFAATARVNFFALNNATAQAAVPAPLSNTRGLELVLNGLSERAPSGTTVAKSAPVTTSVFFENRPD